MNWSGHFSTIKAAQFPGITHQLFSRPFKIPIIRIASSRDESNCRTENVSSCDKASPMKKIQFRQIRSTPCVVVLRSVHAIKHVPVRVLSSTNLTEFVFFFSYDLLVTFKVMRTRIVYCMRERKIIQSLRKTFQERTCLLVDLNWLFCGVSLPFNQPQSQIENSLALLMIFRWSILVLLFLNNKIESIPSLYTMISTQCKREHLFVL